MSPISLLSYILIVIIFTLNNIRGLSSIVSVNIFYASILIYIGLSAYFTDITSHYLFPVLVTLYGVSYYTVLLTSKKSKSSDNLFVNTALFLIPIFLIISESFWEQFCLITMLEMIRIISDSGKTLRRTESTFLNFVNISHRLMLLFVGFVVFYVVAGNINTMGAIKISSVFIGIPLVLTFIVACLFLGGANSIYIEKKNISNYISKNLVAYNYIYQFLIPFVLFLNIKNVLVFLESEIYIQAIFLINLVLIFIIVVNVFYYYRCKDLSYRHVIIRNISMLLISYFFTTGSSINKSEYLLVCTSIILLSNIKILTLKYKIMFKNSINTISNLIMFVTPVSPIFYYLLKCLNETGNVNKVFSSIVIIILIVFLNYELFTKKNFEPKTKVLKYNKFASQRVVYLILGLFINLAALYYEKI